MRLEYQRKSSSCSCQVSGRFAAMACCRIMSRSCLKRINTSFGSVPAWRKVTKYVAPSRLRCGSTPREWNPETSGLGASCSAAVPAASSGGVPPPGSLVRVARMPDSGTGTVRELAGEDARATALRRLSSAISGWFTRFEPGRLSCHRRAVLATNFEHANALRPFLARLILESGQPSSPTSFEQSRTGRLTPKKFRRNFTA